MLDPDRTLQYSTDIKVESSDEQDTKFVLVKEEPVIEEANERSIE
jgi:hypothetical protein